MAPNRYPDSTASSKLRGLNSVGGSSALDRSVPPKACKHASKNAKTTEARSVFIRRATIGLVVAIAIGRASVAALCERRSRKGDFQIAQPRTRDRRSLDPGGSAAFPKATACQVDRRYRIPQGLSANQLSIRTRRRSLV